MSTTGSDSSGGSRNIEKRVVMEHSSILKEPLTDSSFPHFIRLVNSNIPEPYGIATLRSVSTQFRDLCTLAFLPSEGCYIGVVVGMNVLKRDTGGHPYFDGVIAFIAVDPQYRGCKIGTVLLEHCIKQLKEKYYIKEIELYVSTDNTAAQRLYTKFEFVCVEYLKRYYDCGLDAYRMKLQDLSDEE